MKEQDNLEMRKGAWNKPVLTVLVRNNPEERVLAGCKLNTGSGGSGPSPTYDACWEGTERCGQCSDIVYS